jgi:hypothetical protein
MPQGKTDREQATTEGEKGCGGKKRDGVRGRVPDEREME